MGLILINLADTGDANILVTGVLLSLLPLKTFIKLKSDAVRLRDYIILGDEQDFI